MIDILQKKKEIQRKIILDNYKEIIMIKKILFKINKIKEIKKWSQT